MTTDQVLILVDENDNPTGKYARKEKAHTQEGLKHRAFSVLMYNEKGEVLLQKRKHRLWDGLMDLSATSHCLHFDNYDESYEAAVKRALIEELGIVSPVGIFKVGGFSYFEKHKRSFCENEYCAVFLAKFTGKPKINKKVVYSIKWQKVNSFLRDVRKNPKKYTPWAILAAQQFEKINIAKLINPPE
ncbi:MAG TPA: NUDIX domain-containing protein [Patescibacteria group bacterium]